LATDTTRTEPCQIDFYLLGEGSSNANSVACGLALMTWERQQTVFIISPSEASASELDELMWSEPGERFLPHALAGSQTSEKAPINIGTLSSLNPADVVINLGPEAVPQPERFSRVLEIVPYATDERESSRVKFKTYRNQGITPRTQELNK